MAKLADLQDLHAHLLALFAGPLAGVRFPDVDADILATHARSATLAEARVEQLRTELEEARAALELEEERLAGRVERALAYLRVYGEGDPALSAELETLSERLRPARPPAAPAANARRRGRPPRASGTLALTSVPQRNEEVAETPAPVRLAQGS